MTVRIGIAGWSVPLDYRAHNSAASHLEQYARRFDCVEINSSFYKPHLATTYRRWGGCVPSDFRFAVKLPKVITHQLRLVSCEEPVSEFCESVAGLAEKLTVVLMQLPPSLAFDPPAAEAVFLQLNSLTQARIVCEARHPSWFDRRVDGFFRHVGVTRAFADPQIGATALRKSEEKSFSYRRLHGQPRTYYSSYSAGYLHALARRLKPVQRVVDAEGWCIFDNTALGAAWPNAMQLKEELAPAAKAHVPLPKARGCIIACPDQRRHG